MITVASVNFQLPPVLMQVEQAFLTLNLDPEQTSPYLIRKAFLKIDIPSARRSALRDSAMKFHKLFEQRQLAWTPDEMTYLMESFANGYEPDSEHRMPVDKWNIARQLLKKRKQAEVELEMTNLKK